MPNFKFELNIPSRRYFKQTIQVGHVFSPWSQRISDEISHLRYHQHIHLSRIYPGSRATLAQESFEGRSLAGRPPGQTIRQQIGQAPKAHELIEQGPSWLISVLFFSFLTLHRNHSCGRDAQSRQRWKKEGGWFWQLWPFFKVKIMSET